MAEIKIIYEDKNFLAINKPAGLLVHPTAVSKENTLVDWILKRYPEVKGVGDEPKLRPGVVHRLDKDTSGVILIARNQKYFDYLKNLFQKNQIKKTYLALVRGEMKAKAGEIKKPISLKPGGVKRTVWKGKIGKEAVTIYRVLKFFELRRNAGAEFFSLLKVEPKTGRTHQIRVHLASIGHPIAGDKVYGKKEDFFGLSRHFLHAESLEFSIAEGRRVKIEAELPLELKTVIDNLSRGN